MTIPTLSPVPDPPQRGVDTATEFREKADDMMGHLPILQQEMNASIEAMNDDIAAIAGDAAAAGAAADAAVAGTALVSTSSTSMNVTTGAKSPALETGKAFAANDQVVFVRRSDRSVRMYATLNTYNSGTGAATVTVNSVIGSGTGVTDWWVVAEPFLSLMPSTAAEVRAGTSVLSAITPAALVAAAAPVSGLIDAATIAWDMAVEWNTGVVLGGNRTMGIPTNPKYGMAYVLEVIQDATGGRTLSWPGNFEFGAAGVPVLSTGANKRDIIFIYCFNAATPSFRCSVNYAA